MHRSPVAEGEAVDGSPPQSQQRGKGSAAVAPVRAPHRDVTHGIPDQWHGVGKETGNDHVTPFSFRRSTPVGPEKFHDMGGVQDMVAVTAMGALPGDEVALVAAVDVVARRPQQGDSPAQRFGEELP